MSTFADAVPDSHQEKGAEIVSIRPKTEKSGVLEHAFRLTDYEVDFGEGA
ncbi:hypothetical protein [Pedosphaera parvula]|uniref:Uncharacterized protein n=1 Tax=Pedosphaera parvula (strain Ellin514) TaxID=320771 RepID=B9XLN6_PEDPL|nr:hypothetical protein [Pedosphaera parvula]EEF59284.1 hypothetical protein Cflav_PD2135 [Pedosphaera parvula Ellin514]